LLTISVKPDGVGVASQRLIPTGESLHQLDVREEGSCRARPSPGHTGGTMGTTAGT
jgi:hypothetical protein